MEPAEPVLLRADSFRAGSPDAQAPDGYSAALQAADYFAAARRAGGLLPLAALADYSAAGSADSSALPAGDSCPLGPLDADSEAADFDQADFD